MKRMRVWGMLLVLVMCTSIVMAQDAVDMTFTGVGNWTDPNLWDVGSVPGAELLANYVNIMGPNTICTVNTDTGAFAAGNQRLVVDNGATLVLEEGGILAANTWSRIGVSGEGTVIQTGGLFEVQSDKLGIGDKAGGQGYYIMSGGTLTHSGDRGDLGVGSREGTGTFTVIGTVPIIMMEELIVCERVGAAGTVEFVLDANGVSPIVLSNVANIDAQGDTTTSALVVRATEAPPMEDILLVETTSDTTVAGVFDTVNGQPAVEGTEVFLSADGIGCYYTLTYAGGTGNDITLLYSNSVELTPVSLGAYGDIELGNDEQVGPDSSSNGSGLGARDIPERRRVFLVSYDISQLAKPILNVSLNNFSHDQHGQVNVYGVIEDLDLLDVESLTWNTAPGVQNDPTPELAAPVALDMADLTDVLLTFEGPGETGIRFSTDESQALADFINADTDGILTLLVAPSAEGNQLIVRSREHSAGGMLLEGETLPTP